MSAPTSPTHLIVVIAFDLGENGEMVPAFDAREMPTKDRAIREARMLAQKHAGVVAWAREARPDVGEYGEPEELFRHGEIPDLD